jgi:hypothetical protein
LERRPNQPFQQTGRSDGDPRHSAKSAAPAAELQHSAAQDRAIRVPTGINTPLSPVEVIMSWRVPLVLLVAGGVLLGVRAAEPTGDKTDRTHKLAKERGRAARNAYEAVWAKFKPFDLSKGDGEDVYRWSRRWMEAERQMAKSQTERVAALQGHFKRMKKLEQEVQMYARGTIPVQQLAATQFYRAEAELWLVAEKAK